VLCQRGAEGQKPSRDPPPGALQEPPFPSESFQGNKTALGGERRLKNGKAGKGNGQRGEKVWLKLTGGFVPPCSKGNLLGRLFRKGSVPLVLVGNQ